MLILFEQLRFDQLVVDCGGCVMQVWVNYFLWMVMVQFSDDLCILYEVLVVRVVEFEDG